MPEALKPTNSRRKKGDQLPPDFRLDGPALSSDDVARELNTTKQWVLKLAKRDPREHFNWLPGYVKNLDGPGWKRKTDEGRNREVYFYPEDVEKYKRDHPVGEDKDFSTIEVAPELEALIKQMAEEEMNEIVEETGEARGFVRLTGIRDRLIRDHGYSDRIYPQVHAVANRENWPTSGRQQKNIGGKRRGYRIKSA